MIKKVRADVSEVLNRGNPSNPVCEMEIELPDEIEEIDTSQRSRAEVRKAIGHLKNGKAPGIDICHLLFASYLMIKKRGQQMQYWVNVHKIQSLKFK